MIHTYSKIKPEKRLHTVFTATDRKELENRIDMTEEQEFLQCSIMRLIHGKTYKAHKHIIKPQSTFEFQVQEAFIIIEGLVTITIYDLDDSKLCTLVLYTGDLAVLLAGGHSIRAAVPNTMMYEIKTGPYEGQIMDKKFIEE